MMTWNDVEHIARPHLENPSERIANVSVSEDDFGVTTLVVHFAPIPKEERKNEYREGSL